MSQKWHFLENKVEGNQRANGWSMEPMTMREQVGGWICVLDSLCCGPWEGMHLQVAMLGQRWELLSYMWITSPASYTFTPRLDKKLLHSTDLWRRHLHADQVSACIASMSEPIRLVLSTSSKDYSPTNSIIGKITVLCFWCQVRFRRV